MIKKFKVRVRHFSQDKYVVEYAYYYIIPIYRPLCFWFEQSVMAGTECWSENLMDFKAAKELSEKLNSIEDIVAWHEKEKKKEKDFYRRKKEYILKNMRP